MTESDRLVGDPAEVVVCSDKIRQILGWLPQHNTLDTMIYTTLKWHKRWEKIAKLENSLVKQDFKLGSLLLNKEFISEQELNQALSDQKRLGKKLAQILVENTLIFSSLLLSVGVFTKRANPAA